MQERVHYSKAPIVEALIDLRIQTPSSLTVEKLKEIQSLVEGQYTRSEDVYFGEVNFRLEVGQEAQANASQQHIGLHFIDHAKHQSFQARLDGFTFALAPPYSQWESFRDEARRLWNVYRSIALPEMVTRVALRVVNKFDIPLRQGLETSEHLRIYPEIPADLTHGALGGFFMQLQLPQSDLNAMLVLNQARVAPPEPEFVSIMLDIDLFREQSELAWQADDELIWLLLEQFRTRKNEIFEACITDQMRELIL